MTSTVSRPVETRFVPGSIGAPALPQVNLLPPEVRSRRALGRTKARLAVGVVLVLLAVALAYVFASLAKAQAATDLADAQDEAQRLVARQAEFAEVPLVKGQISLAEQALQLAMANEVLWPKYLQAIQAVQPAGVSLLQLTTEMPGPSDAGIPSASPLDAPSVGSIGFTAQAGTLPDLAAWMDALDGIAGFNDATLSTATLTDDEGVVSYEIAATIRVDESVFAGRFSTTEAE